MDGENVSYDPAEGNKPLFNNRQLSDVRFLIEGRTVYGHKQTLAMASPVFNRMFYGPLKEQREVIEIEDLTLVGFKNALRYIYGHPIDYELFELCESYMAADKYLLHHFGEAFIEYVKSRLTVESSCLIYDQLMKIGEREEISLADVRTVIIENSLASFASEHFTQIDQETLISLLSLDRLDIDEVDLLAAVLKWVDCEVQRQGLQVNRENRRQVFQPIKSYVLFTAFKLETVANSKEIAELLTLEEIGSLVLHLNQGEPFVIELKTSRSTGAHSVFFSKLVSAAGFYGTRSVYLAVNRRISIGAIHLTYSPSAPNLSFRVQNCSTKAFLDLNVERSVKDGMLCLSLTPPFEVEANKRYKLFISCGTLRSEDHFAKDYTLRYRSITFALVPYEDYSFVRGFEFVPLD